MTTQHKEHFDTFGFIAMRQLFAAAEMELITREFDAAMSKARNGQPFDGQQCQSVSDWFEGRPVEALLEDGRVQGKIDELLGPDNTFKKGNDGNLYVGDTEWHPDMGWDPAIPAGKEDPFRLAGNMIYHYVPSIKVAFYLDPVGRETGCLRVIPGSHRSPYHERFWSLHLDIPARASSLEHVGPQLLAMWERDTGSAAGGEALLSDPSVNHLALEPGDVPSYAIESEPGDVVFFSHQLWHASFGGASGRRMFTLNFRSAQEPVL